MPASRYAVLHEKLRVAQAEQRRLSAIRAAAMKRVLAQYCGDPVLKAAWESTVYRIWPLSDESYDTPQAWNVNYIHNQHNEEYGIP